MTSLKIYLEDKQYEELRERSYVWKKTMSEIIRGYVEVGLGGKCIERVPERLKGKSVSMKKEKNIMCGHCGKVHRPSVMCKDISKKSLKELADMKPDDLPFSKKKQAKGKM